MTDGEAKKLIFSWKESIQIENEKWLRAVPALRNNPRRGIDERIGAAPGLKQIGAHGLRTNPDGLYAHFAIETDKSEPRSVIEFCDVTIIEVSSNLPNFFDKRSRYAGLGAGLILRTTNRWWREKLEQHGLCKADWIGFIPPSLRHKRVSHPSHNLFFDFMTPVRVSRVLYVLKEKDEKHFRTNNVLAAHEFIINAKEFKKWKTADIEGFISMTSHRHNFISRRKI